MFDSYWAMLLSTGGHTAEMINLLLALDKLRFTPRYYIAAATDNMSLQKARSLENSWVEKVHIFIGPVSF